MDPTYSHYLGIDYSGAETPTPSMNGHRINLGRRETLPVLPWLKNMAKRRALATMSDLSGRVDT